MEELLKCISSGESVAENCVTLSKEIVTKETTFLAVIEGLQDVLIDKDPLNRKKGIVVLVEILKNVSEEFLSEPELQHVGKFLCDRLREHHSVVPVILEGILRVMEMKNVPREIAPNSFHALTENIQCQALQCNERFTIYKIINLYQKTFSEEMKNLGPTFIFGVIQMVESERDPRNLLYLFKMFPSFLQTFPLGQLCEEMFETFACYFPVDFNPSSEGCTITREDLARELMYCLTAIPEFGQFALPLLTEKLESSLKVAKLDSLKVFNEGVKKFEIRQIEPYLRTIWHVIQEETLVGGDREMKVAALACLKELISQISVNPNDNYTFFQNVFDTIWKDILNSITQVEMSMFLPSIQLLTCVGEASPTACEAVLKKVTPVLLSQYYDRSSTNDLVLTVKAMTNFLVLAKNMKVITFKTEAGEGCCDRGEISAFYINAAQHTEADVRRVGIIGLTQIAAFIDEGMRKSVYDFLYNCIMKEEDQSVRNELGPCLKEFASEYPNEMKETIILPIIQASSSENGNSSLIFERQHEALANIALSNQFTSYIINYIVKKVVAKSDKYYPENQRTICAKCLRRSVELNQYTDVSILRDIADWWIHGFKEDESLLLHLSSVVTTIMREQDLRMQVDILQKYVQLLLAGNDMMSLEGFRNILLAEALIVPVHQDVPIPSWEMIIDRLINISINATDELSLAAAVRLIANLVNKVSEGMSLDTFIKEISFKCEVIINDGNSGCKANTLMLFIWITKALFIRGHVGGDSMVTALVNWLANEIVGPYVADGFNIILQESDCLSEANHCNIRFLYRQRFFQTVFSLLHNYNDIPSSAKLNYLRALSYLINGIPKKLLVSKLPQIVPLLVESLEQDNSNLLFSTLETLKCLLISEDITLQEHLQAFIPRFLRLAQNKSSMKVRINALQCLHQFCGYPTHLILPYKQEVIGQLTKCLDDHKRLVRREAVKTRSRWIVVGSPGETRVS